MTSFFIRPQKLFTINPNTERALVFPAVNSFSRFCLHSLVKDSYPELTTFSVGTEKERRPVVCHQSTVAMHALKADNFVNNVSMKHASPGVNFSIILRAAFFQNESVIQTFSVL